MQMSLGEIAVLHITSDYGYGSAGAGGVIPPNADLDFEVELLAINCAPRVVAWSWETARDPTGAFTLA